MERTRFQQVDVTPCSNRQEETEAFMVGALLYIVRREARGSIEGQTGTDTFKVCPPL